MSLLYRLNPQRRREDAEIKSLAEKIIARAETHHRVRTSDPSEYRVSERESDNDVIKRQMEALEEVKRAVREAVAERDLDALRVFHAFDTEGVPYRLNNLKRVIEDLRFAGHQETVSLIHEDMLRRAAKMWLEIFDEGYDKETALYGSKVADINRFSYVRTLRVACLVAPDDVVEYLMVDTKRAMNLVGERLIMDHEELIRVIRTFLDAETPALADGLL